MIFYDIVKSIMEKIKVQHEGWGEPGEGKEERSGYLIQCGQQNFSNTWAGI